MNPRMSLIILKTLLQWKKLNHVRRHWLNGVKFLENGKAKDIEEYQAEILKIGGTVLVPHIHKLFNVVVTQGFLIPLTQSVIIPIFKSSDKNNPSNYRTMMISPLLAKLYGIILEKKITVWRESERKQAKGQGGFIRHHSTTNHLITLRVIAKYCHNLLNLISFVVSWTLGKLLIKCLEITCGID